MTPATRRPQGLGPGWTVGPMAGSTLLLGWVSGVPEHLGFVLAAIGVVSSLLWRVRAGRRRSILPLLPVLGVLAGLSALTPGALLPEAAAGICGFCYVLWLGDEPDPRRAGALGRATPALTLTGVAVVLSLAVVALGPRPETDLGVAAGLLAVGLFLLAVLLTRLPPLGRSDPPAAPPKEPLGF